MATWTDISDAVLEPGKPVRSVDGLALRDNPIAITEGAAGAPRIVYSALNLSNDIQNSDVSNSTLGAEKFQTGTTERDWVLARTSDASVGVVGTYAFLERNDNQQTFPGAVISGGNLRYSNAAGNSSGSSPSGSWRCMGFTPGAATGETQTTVWLRI